MIRTNYQRALCVLPGVFITLALFVPVHLRAQPRGRRSTDTTTAIDSTITTVASPVIVTAPRTPTLQPMPDVSGTSLFVGKKSEQISVSQIDANLSLNNTRQLFAHTSGIHIWEFDGSGIQANVAARGLNPHRSSEFNVRMNGYDIASDPYGYPEVHFTPPFESLERIEIVRGAASLQYGSQFGGLLNYITKAPPADRAIALEASELGGSYGLYSSYTSLGGTVDKFSYESYLNYRRSDGWRESGGYWFVTGNAKIAYAVSPDASLGLEFTGMSFKEHMPNGLTEKQYAENSRASYRPRDWFGAPRVMPALTYDQKISDDTRISVKAAGLAGERNSITLVSSTSILDTGTNRRRVNRDIFRDISLETRLLTQFNLLSQRSILTTGFRIARTNTNRSQGLGNDGSDFNLDYAGPKTLDLDFVSYNYAAFGELKLPITEQIAISPGVRLEHLTTNADGIYFRERSATSAFAFDTVGPGKPVDREFQETFPLFGLGLSAALSGDMNLYGNISQAYRPLLYAQQYPYDQIPVDTAITSSKGYSADLGVRGRIGGIGMFDVSGFFVQYNDRVGVIFPDSVAFPIGYRTNVGASRHYGIESFAELDVLGLFNDDESREKESALRLFTSIAYTSAKYVKGPAEGKKVENSPDWIVRSGITYRLRSWLSTTLQGSYVSQAFSDAANTVFRADGQQGIIPEYSIFDFSVEARVTSFMRAELNVNNLTDRKYFTARATAYPGPGILPGDGRTFTAGLRFSL